MSIEEKEAINKILNRIDELSKKIEDDLYLQNAKLDTIFIALKQIRELNEAVDKELAGKISRIETKLSVMETRVSKLEQRDVIK